MNNAIPSNQEKKKIFFPNLDGLRFFSFLLVFFSHAFATKYDSIRNETWYQIFKFRLFQEGDMGVSFFFVLSGFLITFLLIKEKEYTGNIDVKNFYIRRALRIWPLYYFCVFFGFVMFPFFKSYLGQIPTETSNPILCSTFLNNFDRIINGPPDSSVLSVLWSVAIEEQFYVVWPILFLIISPKKFPIVFVLIITMSLLYRTFYIDSKIDTHTLGVISDMAIGGLGAYLIINSKSTLNLIQNTKGWIHFIPYVLTLILLVFKGQIFEAPIMIIFKRVITSVIFLWIILEQNFANYSLFKISKLKYISYLGKYTYGLYCLHPIANLVTMIVLGYLNLNQYSWQLWLIEFPFSLGLSIVISILSYNLFESRFLKLKDRFAVIVKE